MILGIVTLTFSLFAFFPCLFWFDFINGPIAVVTIIISYISKNNSYDQTELNYSMSGLITSCISMFFIALRIFVLGSLFGLLSHIH